MYRYNWGDTPHKKKTLQSTKKYAKKKVENITTLIEKAVICDGYYDQTSDEGEIIRAEVFHCQKK